ncbi:MAG: hypothetical protein AAF558_00170 [Verrucomicrobiota bacterium]
MPSKSQTPNHIIRNRNKRIEIFVERGPEEKSEEAFRILSELFFQWGIYEDSE